MSQSVQAICGATPLLHDLVVIIADYAGPTANELLDTFAQSGYHMLLDWPRIMWGAGIHNVSLRIIRVTYSRELYNLAWAYEPTAPWLTMSRVCVRLSDLLTPPYKRVRDSMPNKWRPGDCDKYIRLYATKLTADLEAGRPFAVAPPPPTVLVT